MREGRARGAMGCGGAECRARAWSAWGAWGQSMGCMGCGGAEGGVRVQRLAPDRRHVSEAVASAVPSTCLASTVLEGRV